jgi:hypothetical protein
MAEQIRFYDSANSVDVPTGAYAAVYINGYYAWAEVEVARMAKVFRVSVRADPTWAASARCIDVEQGAASPNQAVAFVEERRRLGFDDATVYCDRSTWTTLITQFARAKVEAPLWWIATLDGTGYLPGAWAVQYQGGPHAPYDLSVLHGVDNFHRP